MFRAILPGLFISITSLICPNLKDSASNVKLRPPGWVFGVIWPVLYVTTGLAWEITRKDKEFTALTVLLCSWLVVYSCRGEKNNARFVLVASTLISSYILWAIRKNQYYWLMIPITAWLMFATYLNQAEIRNYQLQQ